MRSLVDKFTYTPQFDANAVKGHMRDIYSRIRDQKTPKSEMPGHVAELTRLGEMLRRSSPRLLSREEAHGFGLLIKPIDSRPEDVLLPKIGTELTKAGCVDHGQWYFRRVGDTDAFRCSHADHDVSDGVPWAIDPVPGDTKKHLQR